VNFMLIVIAAILVVASATIIFILVKKAGGTRALFRAQQEAKGILGNAKEEAQKIKREASLAAKEKQLNLKTDFERQTRDRSRKLNELERRLVKKEENLERKYQDYEKKERDFSQKERSLFSRERELVEKEKGYEELKRKAVEEIERVANMSQEDAKRELIKKMEDEAKLEAQQILRKLEDETREKGLVIAREIISQAIQRSAAEHVVETTVSVVDLPSDDMKGRIIGREGRNIRALELATGVDIIVDDTPEAVILSSFDPIRREMARLAIEKLVGDGRIHPARIEEVVETVKKELEEKIKLEGESVILELRVQDIHPELVKLLGRLKYRTSYGQNALQHLSAARPGARRELLEAYVKRLEKLEKIANSYEGVAKSFALQAGREIRIIVESQKISDDKASLAAKEIAKKIKEELDYPGQIKVTVIREMRAVEYAR